MQLRIEDIDRGRCKAQFEDAIYEDLAWLGLSWPEPVMRQADRFAVYEQALARLAAEGLLYRCFKTRAELSALAGAPHGKAEDAARLTAPLPASEEQKLIADGAPFAWRLNAAAAAAKLGKANITWTEQSQTGVTEHSAPLDQLADDVLARKDFPVSYHLASVIDDAAQDISFVLRGEDLKPFIPLHRVLQDLLGLPAPRYGHHHLIKDASGRRLAKRDRAATLRARRQAGATAEDIRQQLDLSP